MCKPTVPSRYEQAGISPSRKGIVRWQSASRKNKRAFFSFDAAAAFLLAASLFSLFSILLSAAALAASSGAEEQSSSFLALRLSSRILELCEKRASGFPAAPYAESHVLELSCMQELDLQGLLAQSGRDYASVSISGSGGTLLSSSKGAASGEVFCARRLALFKGKMVRLEVCVS